MDLYGKTSRSIPQKILIHLIEVAILFYSYRILFHHGGDWLVKELQPENGADVLLRRQFLFGFNVVTFLRIAYAMIFLIKRKIPWEEAIGVPMAFALYYLGFSFLVIPSSHDTGILEILAILVFLTGCLLNTGGEILRDRWKRNPDNRGKLYTGGFFRYSRHINYFGDILWVTGFAMLTRNPWSAVIPVLLFCFFAFFNAPKLDDYLSKKYGKAFDDYAAGTRMLIPFIY
jgi:protein-S-isoprenylcysteine O-methyltransferase Ste14